jgi:hypothetical protein
MTVRGITVALAAALLLPAGMLAQQPAAATIPRTADGRPDLQGVWDFRTATPLERRKEHAAKPFFTPAEAADFERREAERIGGTVAVHAPGWLDYGAKVLPDRRTSLVVDPADGRIPPLTAAGQQRNTERASARRANGLDGPEAFTIGERCLVFSAGPPLVPGPYNNNIQIVQTSGAVMIYTEMIHDVRIVPVDGRPHLPANMRLWLGDSRGRWEGDTLVVETTNFTDRTPFRGSDEHLRLIERFTRTGADTLTYEFTVDNPTAFTKPWTARTQMARTAEQMYEYACHEGNYGLVNMLSAARYVERSK